MPWQIGRKGKRRGRVTVNVQEQEKIIPKWLQTVTES
jgi:hypothetical protein